MTEKQSGSGIWIAILPLAVFLALAATFYSLLSRDGRDASRLPSALLDKPAPVLEMPPLEGLSENGKIIAGISGDIFKDKLSVVNVFASWCVPCRQEHPQIMALAKDGRFQMVGLNYKDSSRNALGFLGELGNPYDLIGVDRNGRAAIEWGVYGIPETFLVDSEGRVFHKHVGPINREILEKKILPLLEQKL